MTPEWKWPPGKTYTTMKRDLACIVHAIDRYGPLRNRRGQVVSDLAQLLHDCQAPYRPTLVNDKNLQSRVAFLCADAGTYKFGEAFPRGIIFRDIRGKRSYELRLLIPRESLPVENPLPQLISLADVATQLSLSDADVRKMADAGALGTVTTLRGERWAKAATFHAAREQLARVDAMQAANGMPQPPADAGDDAWITAQLASAQPEPEPTNGTAGTPTRAAELSDVIAAGPASANGSAVLLSESERSTEPTAADVGGWLIDAGNLITNALVAVASLGGERAPSDSGATEAVAKELESALTRLSAALESSERYRRRVREAEETAVARKSEAETLRKRNAILETTIGTLQVRIGELSKGLFVDDNAVRSLERVVSEKPRTGARA